MNRSLDNDNPPSGGQPQIVLVEDDEALSKALVFGLTLEGFQVETHTEAGSVRFDHLPHAGCLVIDDRLPGESGLSLLARLRLAAISLPAIVITTQPSLVTRRRTAMLDATLVEKPLLGEGLVNAIREALDRGGPT